MTNKILLFLCILFSSFTMLLSEVDLSDLEYGDLLTIRLINGDIISGEFIDYVEAEEEQAIKVKTAIGKATIYKSQIAELNFIDDTYKHNHRIFLMPTADPIGDDHFVGNFELVYLYGGFGISDFLSVTAGRSLIPIVDSRDQVSNLNIKATVYTRYNTSNPGYLSIAVGTSLAFINHNNRISHVYAVGSFQGKKSKFNLMTYMKLPSKDFYTAKFDTEIFDFRYNDGSIGIGLGLDTKFTSKSDMRFIGEIWNSDITNPSNSAILVGLRMGNTKFSADFGLSFFTTPFIAPFFSFVWTPF